MDEFDNHDLRSTFLAVRGRRRNKVIFPDLLIRTGAESSTMKQWHGTAKARQPAAAFPIRKYFPGQKDGCIPVVLKP